MIDLNNMNVVNDLLNRAVSEKGEDYAYPLVSSGCVYFHEGQPSCIVGHVIAYAGVGAETAADANIEGSCAFEALTKLGFNVSPEIGNYLNDIQGNQDIGITWGDSIFNAQANLAGD